MAFFSLSALVLHITLRLNTAITETMNHRKAFRTKKKDGRSHPLNRETRSSYFFGFFGVLAAVFFAVPHGPFDLQGISNLLFENSFFKISHLRMAVNNLRLQTGHAPVIIIRYINTVT